jgi:hypothetical protein
MVDFDIFNRGAVIGNARDIDPVTLYTQKIKPIAIQSIAQRRAERSMMRMNQTSTTMGMSQIVPQLDLQSIRNLNSSVYRAIDKSNMDMSQIEQYRPGTPPAGARRTAL